MAEILVDSFKDVIKVVPLMFIIFYLVDWGGRKLNKRPKLLTSIGNYGVLSGGLLGLIPQCGVPVAFAKFYGNGHISLGMLLAVFLASSDEALIIISAHPSKLSLVGKILLVKFFIAVVAGYLINVLIKEKRNKIQGCGLDCHCPRCSTKDSKILPSVLLHTTKITVFLFVTVFLINFGLEKMGAENLNRLLGKNSFLQPVYAAFIGAIPSCFSSVFIAEGFIKGTFGFGSTMAGLCANTGYGILVLLKEMPFHKTLKVFVLLQLISILVGEIFYFILR